jgi:phosphoribosylanthranilate isomerase
MLPGGNGLAFDWNLLGSSRQSEGFILSGGLNPDNVAKAIRVTGAPIVDVSSGVEFAPGKKDLGLIRKFIEAAKAAR